MHTRAAAHLLKLFTWRLFCMVVLRFSAGKEATPAERSAPSEASTAVSRARRVFPCNSAPPATSLYQSNVIRIHTRQRKPSLQTGWSPVRPHTQSTGEARSTKKRNPMAKDSRLLPWQEPRGTTGKEVPRETKLRQRRLGSIETSRAFHRFQKARDRGGLLASYLCGQSLV
jgi:hypothetical protein